MVRVEAQAADVSAPATRIVSNANGRVRRAVISRVSPQTTVDRPDKNALFRRAQAAPALGGGLAIADCQIPERLPIPRFQIVDSESRGERIRPEPGASRATPEDLDRPRTNCGGAVPLRST